MSLESSHDSICSIEGTITEIFPVAGIIAGDDGEKYLFPLTDYQQNNLPIVEKDPKIGDEVELNIERRDLDRTDFRHKTELLEDVSPINLSWGVKLLAAKSVRNIVEKLE